MSNGCDREDDPSTTVRLDHEIKVGPDIIGATYLLVVSLNVQWFIVAELGKGVSSSENANDGKSTKVWTLRWMSTVLSRK